jgi:hypothetical protein
LPRDPADPGPGARRIDRAREAGRVNRLLVAILVVALGGGAAAFAAGRAARPAPPAPTATAAPLEVRAVDAQPWRLEDTQLPEMVTP